MLSERKIQRIRYTKSNKNGDTEVTDRVIIPTFVPKPNIKAIDVSECTQHERQEIEVFMREYNDYLESRAVGTFKFEEWVQHSKNIYIEPKWRTFKQDQTEEIS